MNRLVMTFAALLGLLGLRAAERDFHTVRESADGDAVVL